MTKKIISIIDATSMIKSGMSIMVGGFLCNGSPHGIIDGILSGNATNLTVICNDAGMINRGVGKLIAGGRVKQLIASHIGTNPLAGQKMSSKEMQVDLVPQGTLAERIRAGGFGLGGILTPVGIGTSVEIGKVKIRVNEKSFLLEEPLRADIALISGYQTDRFGNVFYKGSTQNFNPLMATSADTVIVETDSLVENLKPEYIHTPGLFIDYIVNGGSNNG